MTNYEKIKGMTLEELGAFLCNSFDLEFENCDECPVSQYCGVGHNGFTEWLKSEAKEISNPYYH